jgi:DNA-binding PadR family transcriptional regulator
MNSLAYALLSMLVRKSCTGYELSQFLETFWQAKHSQIYPLLKKLENADMLTFVYEHQTTKPDKKIYTITPKGKEVLSEWVAIKPSPPVSRDEFLIKAYAIWLTDSETASELFNERIDFYQKKIDFRKEKVAEMEQEYGQQLLDPTASHFGRYILFKRKLKLEQDEVEWCQWVLSILVNNTEQSSIQ